MNKRSILNTLGSLGTLVTLAGLLVTGNAAAAENASGWNFNLTPVLLPAKGDIHFGGGVDPEVKYTQDLGGARLSAGLRVGGYYAQNLFGVTAMPTLRLSVPVGPVEPFASFGMGYGWLPNIRYEDFATMSRIGMVFHFSAKIAIGVEGTFQQIQGSSFRFPSLGSALAFDL